MVNWPTGLLGYPTVKRVCGVSVDKPNSRPGQQGGGCCQTSLVTASQTQWAKCPLGYCASTVGNKLPWLAANDFSHQWCQRIELPLGLLLNSTVSFRQLCAFPGSFPGNSTGEFLGFKLKSNSQLCCAATQVTVLACQSRGCMYWFLCTQIKLQMSGWSWNLGAI